MGEVDFRESMEAALKDQSKMEELCLKLQSEHEGVTLLYQFFEAHGKTRELVKWAIDKETSTLENYGDLCREENFCTKLFFAQFFGELGKKYLCTFVSPLIKEIVENDRSLEIEESLVSKEDASKVNVIENVKVLIDKTKATLNTLTNSLESCPLFLRESFSLFVEAVEKKFGNPHQIVASLFFLRFICPTIINPNKFADILYEGASPFDATKNKKHNVVIDRGLVYSSKFLQYVANGSVVNGKAYSPLLNKFIEENHQSIITFIKDLVDPKMITMMKKIVTANSKISIEAQKEAAKTLEEFLKAHSRRVNGLELSQAKESFLSDLDKLPWKQSASKKKFAVYSCKKDNSEFPIWKLTAKIPTTLQKVEELLEDYPRFFKLMGTAIDEVLLLEKVTDSISDYHITMRAVFPLSARDCIIRLKKEVLNPRELLLVGSSVDKAGVDSGGRIRMNALVIGHHVAVDKSDPSTINFTMLWQVDIGGKSPAWLANTAAKGYITFLETLQTELVPSKKKKNKDKEKK